MSKIKYVLVGENAKEAISKTDYFFKISIFCFFVFVVIFYYTSYTSNNDVFSRYYYESVTEFKENSSVIATTQPGIRQSTPPPTIAIEKTAPITTTYKYIATIKPTPEALATTTTKTVITESTQATTESPRNRTTRVTIAPLAIRTTTPIATTTPKHQLSTPKIQQQQQPPPPQFNESNYYVLTSQCRIPYVDPFTPGLRKIFKPGKPAKCYSDRAIITPIYNVSTRQYTLHLAEQHVNGTAETVSCCYRTIVRSGSGANVDKSYKLLPCEKFQQDYVVPIHIDSMIVDCTSSAEKLVQQDAFSFIQYRNLTVNTTTNGNSSSASNATLTLAKRKPSILFIGIDSLSRMNFRRNMPKTFNYIKNNSNWIELEGYNKIGDNTYPNLMALLSGYNNTFAYSMCNPKKVGGLETEGCNIIWNTFKKFGYRTAYAEDTCSISTFNYLKKGFVKQPTDYYLRPMMLAIEKVMHVQKKNQLPFCIGRKQYGEYIYDFAQQFANVYNAEPKFGFFWTNSFSHNSYDASSTMDNRMLEYLKSFANDGILESSIVVFFSDHGARWGPLLKLPEGFLEERLPMFFISLPTWFRNEHPEFVQALEVNRHRLTSPYDIHMTLKHILELGSDAGEKLPPSSGCEKCQSIFRVIPENRTCTDAGIIEHWCTCVPYQVVSKYDKVAKNVAQLVIKEMNKYLGNKNMSSICSTLNLKTIKEVQLKMAHNDTATDLPTYRIRFLTNPKAVNFQATAIYDPLKKAVQVEVEEDISRLSLYANTSQCTTDKQAKKYCICKK